MSDYKQNAVILNNKLIIRKKWIYSSVLSALAVLACGTARAELPQGGFIQTCERLNGITGVAPTTPTTAQTNFKAICSGPAGGVAGVGDAADNTAVSALRHEEAAAEGTTTQQSSQKQVSNLQERMEEVREDDGTNDSSSALLESSRRSFFINGGFRNGEGEKTNDDAGFGNGVTPGTLADPERATVVQGERAFDTDGQEITVGMDYRLEDEKTIVGAALGYDQREVEFTDQSATDDIGNNLHGGVESDGVHISGYMTRALSDTAYLDGVVSVGNSDLTITRPVPKINATGDGPAAAYDKATGKPGSTQFSASLGGGYDINSGDMTITPYARMDYTKTSIDAYEETLATTSEGMALRVAKQEADSLLGSAGVKASKPIRSESGTVFVPQASVELGHEFSNDPRNIEATLVAADGLTGIAPSVVRTSDPDRNHVKLGAGVSAVFSKGRSGFVHLESIQGNDQYSDTAVKFGYRMEF